MYISSNKELLLDWDYEANSGVDPNGYFTTRQKANWKCHKCNFKWLFNVKARFNGYGVCPKCYPNKARNVYKGANDLATLRPDLLVDWDYEKNKVSPDSILLSSNIQASWKCHKCGHKWTSRLDTRTKNGSGCPVCNTGGGSSCADFLLYLMLKPLGAEYRSRVGRYEADVKLGNLLIEYDGVVWHVDPNKDAIKDSFWQGAGYSVFRIKERDDEFKTCDFINETTVSIPKLVDCTFSYYKTIYPEILKLFGIVDSGFACSEYVLNLKYEELKALTHAVPYGTSMQYVIDNGLMNLLWDYKKNSIQPKDVIANGNSYAWVLCNNGHSSRMRCDCLVEGYSCPVCSGQVIPSGTKKHEIAYNLAVFSDGMDDVLDSRMLRSVRKTLNFTCPHCGGSYKMGCQNVQTTRRTRHCECTAGEGVIYVVVLGRDNLGYCYYCTVYGSSYFLMKVYEYDYVLNSIGVKGSNVPALNENLYKRYIGDPYLLRSSWSKHGSMSVSLEGKRFVNVTSSENILDCFINLNRQINGLPTI